jgi:hypothetical protein
LDLTLQQVRISAMRRTLLRQLRYLPLVRALVGPGRDHRQRVADCPERQQPDAELALQTVIWA